MRDVKEFQERFNRYKNGESVSDIYNLPRYGDGKQDKYSSFVSKIGPSLYKKLLQRGVSNIDSVYDNMMRQLAYESTYGTSRVAKDQHNYGGYGWNGKTYTTFASDDEFLDHYLNIMTGRHKKSLLAKDPLQYARSLKDSGYYEDTVENYSRNLSGMKSISRTAAIHRLDNPDLYKIQTYLIPNAQLQIIEKPDALLVKQTIPEKLTRYTWTGAEKASPYVTGRPMLKLKPAIKLPNLIDLIEDSEWSPTFGFKNGKLPRYKGGKVNLGANPTNATINSDGTFTDDYTKVWDDLTITPKGAKVKNLYRYQEPWDDEKFVNAVTLGGLNNLMPSQWIRRVYDLATGNLIADSWLNGNSGVVPDSYAKEHPLMSMAANGLVDFWTLGGPKLLKGVLSTGTKLNPVSKKSIQNFDTVVKDGEYVDIHPQMLNDNINPIGNSVYGYEHPSTTGFLAGKYRSSLPEEWFKYDNSSLEGYPNIAFSRLTSLYRSPAYRDRVYRRFGSLYKRDMFMNGLEERFANAKVSEPADFIIKKRSPGKYQYLKDSSVRGQLSGDRILVIKNQAPNDIIDSYIHEFGHLSDRPFGVDPEYFTNSINEPYKMTSILNTSETSQDYIEYINRLREQRLRVLVGLSDMARKGLNINDEYAIQSYLGNDLEDLPLNVLLLLEAFDYRDVINAFKNMLGIAAPVSIGYKVNEYKDGKSPIYIKPANRGKLTRLKARTGKSESELYNDGNPAHKKMVVFARNSRKWRH